jgi:pterin-4a-carbinolamine dehydratase
VLFDFSKSAIKNIRKLTTESYQPENSFDLPIPVEKNEWSNITENNSSYLQKKFDFKEYKHMIYFISEILKETHRIKNVPEMIINDSSIIVNISSDFLGDITSIEINISKFVNEIYEDIRYI